jgi:hypothetical protein
MLAPVENVAVLALVYRTAWRNCYSGAGSLDDDMEGNPDGISLLGMIGSQGLTPADWELVALMGDRSFPAELAAGLAEWSSQRCEALLHAWPQDPRDELGNPKWARPYMERWELVAATMTGLEPLTWDREQTREVFAHVSGQPLADVLEDEQALDREWATD